MAYRLTPAASENPSVRPSVASSSIRHSKPASLEPLSLQAADLIACEALRSARERLRSAHRDRRATGRSSRPARRSSRRPSPAARTSCPSASRTRPPDTATGTIGACALIAMMKPPFLNGKSSAVRLRVPSGKIRNELPARIDAAARSIDAIDASRRSRSTGTNPPATITAPEHRQLRQLGLEQHVQALVQRLEQHRRIDVALVIRAEHHRAIRGNVLAAAHAIANAGQSERQADADVAGNVERGLVLEADADRERDRTGDQDVEGNDDVGQYRTNGGNEC